MLPKQNRCKNVIKPFLQYDLILVHTLVAVTVSDVLWVVGICYLFLSLSVFSNILQVHILFMYYSFFLIVTHLKLEKGMATHSSILTWRIPWIEEPGRL